MKRKAPNSTIITQNAFSFPSIYFFLFSSSTFLLLLLFSSSTHSFFFFSLLIRKKQKNSINCRRMLVPKNVRKLVYEKLFNEGVMVAKKDYNAPKHCILPVRNLYVIKLAQSLTSKGYVRTQFSWQWYYYYLTNEGIEYLREYLHVPDDVVPETMKKPRHQNRLPSGFRGGPQRGDRYKARRFAPGDNAKVGAPGGYQPGFRGGDRSGGRGSGGGDRYRSSGGFGGRGAPAPQ
mmetsp:Transcript_17452/g.25965  ORF Transcript_17452/g.25965 Transcript_17452/m.25965 type:complete len:233 (+) Transcript_17452:150-848(+)